ncbi:MAG TPA: metallophosphoesterase, partial [Verrucomicrobiae bacterium]|nr:metallophosphoesterase [Verrucomicrobiae bacterium]
TGDVLDRGADSRKAIDLLRRLEREASSAGGRVHALIGNHEAMNIEGDLRYVHPGEYAAFADRNSSRVRDAYYRQTQDWLRANPPPTGVPEFNEAFRAQWETEHPLGYVEHRQAWAPTGYYGRWIASHESVIRINDTLFLHAGIGPSYLPAERDAMNQAVRDALNGQPDPVFVDILTNQEGPLWYRGLSLNQEPTEEPHLAALLARHGVSRIIVGHTKRAATVLPRFGGRVIITDIAQRDGYADPHAFLIIENGALTTIHRGHRVPLNVSNQAETCAYLDAILALEPQDTPLRTTATQCRQVLQLPANAP